MTEERTIIEKRDAADFENAEWIKLRVLRKLKLRYARFCSRQKWSKGGSEFLRKNRLGFYLLNSKNLTFKNKGKNLSKLK